MNRNLEVENAGLELADALREMEAEEHVVITRAGLPVASLTPLRASRPLTAEQQPAAARIRARMACPTPPAAS